MDFTTIIVLFMSWVVKRFPSLEQYSEFVFPALLFFLTFLGIFTNALPEPGHKYPVPDVVGLEKELEGGGAFVIRLAKFTRSTVIGINWFLGTVIYKGFYRFTNNFTVIALKFKSIIPTKKA